MSETTRLDIIFGALSNPTRRSILAHLRSGPATVNELCEPFDMSQPAISKHISVLEEAGLVTRTRDAQRRPCRLAAGPMEEVSDWLEEYRDYWEGTFRHLDTLFDKLQAMERRLGGGP